MGFWILFSVLSVALIVGGIVFLAASPSAVGAVFVTLGLSMIAAGLVGIMVGVSHTDNISQTKDLNRYGSDNIQEIHIVGSFPDNCVELVEDPLWPDSWRCVRQGGLGG